jgi:hypothetical protein
MAVIWTPGGFQSYLPPLQQRTPTPSGGGGGGSSGGGGSGGSGGSSPSPQTTVVVNPINGGAGAEVIINGQGFSVIGGQVESFLSSRGLSGSSYNSAITKARDLDKTFEKQQALAKVDTGLKVLRGALERKDFLKDNNKNLKVLEGSKAFSFTPKINFLPSLDSIEKFQKDRPKIDRDIKIKMETQQAEFEKKYLDEFSGEEAKIKVLDYDGEGYPISFEYRNKVYDGKDAEKNLNLQLNKVTERRLELKQNEENLQNKGLRQFALDKAFEITSADIEKRRQQVFNVIDVVARSKWATKEDLDKLAADLNVDKKDLQRIEKKTLTLKRDEFWDNVKNNLDKTKGDIKAEFTKGLVDDVFDILNIANVATYAVASDKNTRKELKTAVLTSLALAPATYVNYLKKDPLKGIAFTAGSIYGIDGLLNAVSSTGKVLSKAAVESNIAKAVKDIEAIKTFNLNKLTKAGFNVNKLTTEFGIDFARVVSGLDDASSIGLKIDLKKASPKYINAWNMFEGAGETAGKIDPKILKKFSDKELSKIDIKLISKAETELSGGVIKQIGKKIQDLTGNKITTRKIKGLTFEANQVPTGRIFGKKTGKNYRDAFTINPDKSFSGIAKRIMKDGDIVEQKYYTKGINSIVREFYVNGKLKYTVTQARNGGRVVVKSGKDIVLQSLKNQKFTKKLELLESSWKEIKRRAILSDVNQNFKGRVISITKTLDDIKVSPLKKSFSVEILLRNGKKFQKIDTLTPAKIVNSKSQAFADFLKQRQTVLLAGGYVQEITKLKSVILPEYVALRRTTRSLQLRGIFKRNATLFEKTKLFIQRLNTGADRIFNLKMNKRGSARFEFLGKNTSRRFAKDQFLGKNKYLDDYKFANRVKIDYAKPLQVNIEKSILDMSRVLNTFQKSNVSFGFRKIWASRLIRLKLQSEYLKYLNRQHIINTQEYAKLTRLESKQDMQSKQQMEQVQKMATAKKMKSETTLKFDRKMDTKTRMKFGDMGKLKMDFMKFPKLGDDSKKKFVDKVLGTKKAKSYIVLLGSGKKQRVASKRLKPEEAISYGAYLTDRKGDRTVRIVPAKGKPNQRFKLDYLSQASQKFRNYRIKRGKRVAYSSARLIEKRKYFNDLEKMGGKKKVIRQKSKRR